MRSTRERHPVPGEVLLGSPPDVVDGPVAEANDVKRVGHHSGVLEMGRQAAAVGLVRIDRHGGHRRQPVRVPLTPILTQRIRGLRGFVWARISR
jgi:hypothetical protein